MFLLIKFRLQLFTYHIVFRSVVTDDEFTILDVFNGLLLRKHDIF